MIFSWRTTTGLPPARPTGYAELDPSSLRIVRGAEAVILRLRWRLGFFRGEWFLDTRLGIPFYGQILVRNPSRNLISQIVRDVIRTTPGVREVVSIDVKIDKRERRCDVDFEARLDDGETIVTAQDAPLLLRRV